MEIRGFSVTSCEKRLRGPRAYRQGGRPPSRWLICGSATANGPRWSYRPLKNASGPDAGAPIVLTGYGNIATRGDRGEDWARSIISQSPPARRRRCGGRRCSQAAPKKFGIGRTIRCSADRGAPGSTIQRIYEMCNSQRLGKNRAGGSTWHRRHPAAAFFGPKRAPAGNGKRKKTPSWARARPGHPRL